MNENGKVVIAVSIATVAIGLILIGGSNAIDKQKNKHKTTPIDHIRLSTLTSMVERNAYPTIKQDVKIAYNDRIITKAEYNTITNKVYEYEAAINAKKLDELLKGE